MHQIEPESWILRCRWQPGLIAQITGDDRVVAVDYIPSAMIPRAIYNGAVLPLCRSHARLRVIVVIDEGAVASFADAQGFCAANGLGLKSIGEGPSLETIVTIDIDRGGTSSAVPSEDVWFPRPILNSTRGLTHLSFCKTLDAFASKVEAVNSDQSACSELVRATVGELLDQAPGFAPSSASVLRLEQFERMLRISDPESTEHVLHSFRVFLAGCAVVNKFYSFLTSAHNRFTPSGGRPVGVEYCWLLTAIFHDIGKPKEIGSKMLQRELEDEDATVRIEVDPRKWQRHGYSVARNLLSSLGSFVANKPRGGSFWDPRKPSGPTGRRLEAELVFLYNKSRSHAVIGALDLLAKMIDQADASGPRRCLPIIESFAAPAALSILLHDWKIRKEAKAWGLFPVDGNLLPLAALLVYIDTWDDYRRSNSLSPIDIEAFEVNSRGAKVTTLWQNKGLLAKENRKHESFRSAIVNCPFSLEIEPLCRGPE
jgi:hypothetical protein